MVWEPQLWVSVCVRPLPKKTRPERRWDLISAQQGRKLVSLGGWGGGLLLVQEEKREWDSERKPLPSSPIKLRCLMLDPCLFGGCAFLPMWCVTSSTPPTLSQWFQCWNGVSSVDPYATERSAEFRALYLYQDHNSTAGEPEGHCSEHVQGISCGYTTFRDFMQHATLHVHNGLYLISHWLSFYCFQAGL